MAICNSVQNIASSECIGDSLVKINNNFSNLNTDVCTLLSLINTLSSNMSQVLNVPYARLVERSGDDTSISDERALTGATGSYDNIYSQDLFPLVSTSTVLGSRYLKLNTTPTTNVDTIGIIKNTDRSIQFPSTGRYGISITGPVCRVFNYNVKASLDLEMVTDSGVVVLGGPTVFTTWDVESCYPSLEGRITVTNTATKYFFNFKRNMPGNGYKVFTSFPSNVAGACTLFGVEIFKYS